MIATRSRNPSPRLDSMQRVRLELVTLYRQARDGQRDVGDATKLAYLLNSIARILEAGELEKRLEALERLVKVKARPS